MITELSVHVVHHGEMRMAASAGQHVLKMDYPLNDEQADGFRPLEVLLASLAGCSGNSLAILLTKAKQAFKGLEVTAKGKRRETHPTVFTEIALEFKVMGNGVKAAEVEKALKLSEDKICPVWAMLKGSTAITATYKIEAEAPA